MTPRIRAMNPASHLGTCVDTEQHHVISSYVSGQFDDSPDDLSNLSAAQEYFVCHATNGHPTTITVPDGCRQGGWCSTSESNTANSNSPAPSCPSSSSGGDLDNDATPNTQERIERQTGQGTQIISFTDKDVLCGRGGKTNNHSGNREYRLLVDLHREEYFASRKPRKTEISRAIVSGIRNRGGRFLKYDGRTCTWSDVGDVKAVEKTSQALREGAAQKLRDILSTAVEPATSPSSDLASVLRASNPGQLSSLAPDCTSSASKESFLAAQQYRSHSFESNVSSAIRESEQPKKRWFESHVTEQKENLGASQLKRMRRCPSA